MIALMDFLQRYIYGIFSMFRERFFKFNVGWD
jgi:hypothetical protein